MSLLGKLVNGVGRVGTIAVGVTIKATGQVVGLVGEAITKDNNVYRKVTNATHNAGEYMYKHNGNVGRGLEKTVDTTFAVTAKVGSATAGGIAKIAGASEKTVERAKKIGGVAAGAGLGLLAGDVIGSTVSSVAALGTASTGTAIPLLGGAAHTSATLAHIGGGSLATGGAGMAGGQAVLNGINAASTIDGAASGYEKTLSNKRQNNY